jgi:hypothetical protein
VAPGPQWDLTATEVRVDDVRAGARDDHVPAVPGVDEVPAWAADELVELGHGCPDGL